MWKPVPTLALSTAPALAPGTAAPQPQANAHAHAGQCQAGTQHARVPSNSLTVLARGRGNTKAGHSCAARRKLLVCRAPRARALAALQEEGSGNGAASHAQTEPPARDSGRFRSSISLKRLLDASRHLGAPFPGGESGGEAADMGQGVAGLAPRDIGDKPACERCAARGAVACATCETSGLYTDPVLESQGVLVKVRCLGCGGSGAIMCPDCGGRGFLLEG